MITALFEKLKWHRIGYIEGHVRPKENQEPYIACSVLYVREPFLWFRTRKTVEIGDAAFIRRSRRSSPHYRAYCRDKEYWLLGGKIDYISENGTNTPGEVIRLVDAKTKV